jgi:hypothetical protein
MKLMRSSGLIAATVALLTLSATNAAAQAPVVTWQQIGSGLRAEWAAIPGATHYEAFVDGMPVPMPILTPYFQVGPVPVGSYVLQIRAAAGATKGPLSAPVTVVISAAAAPGCSTLSAPTLTVTTSGMTVSASWDAVAGAAGYLLQVGTTPGATQFQQQLPPNQTTFSAPVPMLGTFYVRVAAGNACGALSTSSEQSFTIGAATPGPVAPPTGSGPRTPDPAAGQRLPLPAYMQNVIVATANAYGNELHNSCVEHGGNNVWLFRLVRALRQFDSRWGLNWKRGNRGDMSQDVVTYNFGPGADEDTTNVYIIDVISGHCGNRPGPNWADVTEATRLGGTIGRWTLLPYLRAGYPADSRQ